MTRAGRTITRSGHQYQVWDHRDSDGFDFWAVFESGQWEPEVDEILATYLTPKSTFIDVGAWIGPISIIAATVCGQVHAVEPDPAARAHLVGNANLQPQGTIAIHGCAIGDHDGVVRIGRRADREFGDSMTSTIFAGDAIEVPSVTIESLVESSGATNIDLIKMDIEGGEEMVLPQCAPFLQRHRVPLLLSTHTALATDRSRYLHAMRAALDPFTTTHLAGSWDTFGAILAVPR